MRDRPVREAIPTMADGLDEVLFELRVTGVSAPWRVARVRAVERLSELFECEVEAAPGAAIDDLRALLGQPAVVEFSRGGSAPQTHRFAGLVARVTDRGWLHGDRVLALTVVPSLWVLGQRSDARVFQNLTTREVVAEVLRDAQLYQQVGAFECRFDESADGPRECCTQYNETDLDFVRRLLEEDGLAFRFDTVSGDDRLVVFDAARADALPARCEDSPAPVMGQGGVTADRETLRRCVDVREVTPDTVTLRDYDFTRPDLALHHRAQSGAGAASVYAFPAGARLEGYDPGAMQYASDDLRRIARTRLEGVQSAAARTVAESNLVGLAPGEVLHFQREDAGASEAVLVTAVEHRGQSNEVLLPGDGRDPFDRYSNTLDAVPAGTAWRPPRVTSKPRALAPQIAVVVGEGTSSPVESDEYGRVLVRFRWDQGPDRARAYRSGSTRSSCWLRVSQPWAGEGWGVMFTPRVGMEVLVQFVDADPDRPVITGCLYNGTHRPPVAPRERSRSVIRTQSTGTSGGYNELLFEDLEGEERVAIRAQRDLAVESLRDRAAKVGRHDSAQVAGDATLAIEGRQRVSVKGDRTTELQGRDTLTVDGDVTVTVHGAAASHVAGEHQVSADEGFVARSGGNAKATLAPDGATLKAAEVTVQATRSLTLKCAGSAIELSAQGVKITASDGSSITVGGGAVKAASPAGTQLELGPGATLQSASVVALKGALITLN